MSAATRGALRPLQERLDEIKERALAAWASGVPVAVETYGTMIVEGVFALETVRARPGCCAIGAALLGLPKLDVDDDEVARWGEWVCCGVYHGFDGDPRGHRTKEYSAGYALGQELARLSGVRP